MQKTVLLVDDDEDEYCILKMALEMTNYDSTCMWANNLEDAIRILHAYQPEMVFIDINMPRNNGFICLEEMKKAEPVSHSAFVMYSTYINEDDKKKALDSGASCCMPKAHSLTMLQRQLNILLNGQ